MIDPNRGIFDRVTRLQIQLSSLERSLAVEAQKKLASSLNRIRANLVMGNYPGPFETTSRLVSNDVLTVMVQIRDWFLGELNRIAGDINSRAAYLLTGSKRRTESEPDLVVLEAEEDDEEDIIDQLREIGETLLLLSATELYLLMVEWRWKGFTLRQQWDNFMSRQYRQVYETLMGAAAMAQLEPGSYVLSQSARQTMAVELQRKVIGNSNAFTLIGGINATMNHQLSNVAFQVLQTTVARNGEHFAGVRWHSMLEPSTCPTCANLHGQWFPFVDGRTTAPALPQHARCQCSLVPELRRFSPVNPVQFSDWFQDQPDTFQRKYLGPDRYKLWKSGQVSFRDFVQFRNGIPYRKYNLNDLGE